jgi:hypothetical protein
MPRKPSNVPQARVAAPAPLPAQEVVDAAAALLRPAVRLLLHSGVSFPRFAAELKTLFIEEAAAEIQRAGHATTDSAVSLLSGAHRKDVRAWRETGRPAAAARPVALSARVFARWLADRRYTNARGKPRALPRTGDAPSFEALVRAETQDVHPFTVLQELIRLGIVEVEVRDERELVVPARVDFVPPAGSQEALELLAGNAGDHIAAAVSNMLGEAPQLEQSVFAAGITAASADRLHALARTLWARARLEMIEEATRLYAADQDKADATQRVRFGSYFRSAAWQAEPPKGQQQGDEE